MDDPNKQPPSAEEAALIKRMQEGPDAPQQFDMVKDEEAALPLPPSETDTKPASSKEIGVADMDPHSESRSLPRVDDLPEDWALILDGSLQLELRVPSTLPMLWEAERGEQVERVVAISDKQLFYYDKIAVYNSCRCHAMPLAIAEEFVKWIGAQVFFRRPIGQYVECYSVKLECRNMKTDSLHVAFHVLPTTSKFKVVVGRTCPPAMTEVAPDKDVIHRAKVALDDPKALLTATQLT